MLLSVIIVNYNVRYFLEQCLCSLQAALGGIAAEVLVVDNASADNSISYLSPRFPWVHFIQNTTNEGFARANNRALQLAKGQYILFLNPDTLLAEDTLQECLTFFASQANAGVVGVRMLDGSGRFLPESKRAFPSPRVSFYKLAGLSTLFPTSRIFNRYALGYLPNGAIHAVDVLAGAFMMIKKSVLDKVGGFDERFFMYAEDIDLSYRVQVAGYTNYYLGHIAIVHFKGESTKRGSLHYVHLFYQAMRLFVKKHYRGGGAWLFNNALYAGILIRQLAAALALPLYKKNSGHKMVPQQVFIVGDEAQAALAQDIVKRHFLQAQINSISILQDGIAGKDNLVVFCTGTAFTNKTAIQWVHKHAKKSHFAWCIKGSRSIVGSSSKVAAGEVWT